jgi:hypothetical protein
MIRLSWPRLIAARRAVAVAAAALSDDEEISVDNCDHYDPYGSRFQVLVGAAGLSTDIRHRLLNGQRRQVSAELDLSDQEIETVLEIEAKTLRDFARDLHERVIQ